MITDYEGRKNEVLDCYKKSNHLVNSIRNNAHFIKMPDPFIRLEGLLQTIKNKAEKVEKNIFTIMVAGESKSGKSTFINAYLGIDLLPMDVKQCTSAIIVIKNGKSFGIKATYADGRHIEIQNEQEIKKFLQENAALDDNFRDIPVPTINSEILVKSGLRAKDKNQPIKISSTEVQDLLNAPEVQEANIHNLPNNDYNNKIKSYIEERKNNWQYIVTHIEITFPLGEDKKGIEIIDSPGICARGGVSSITSQYIEKADAIIFLKPISGQALESTHFNQFMRNVSVERNKGALFLILTRTTNVSKMDFRRLENEAHRQFNNLNKDHIILVDSKAELYVNKFRNINDIEVEIKALHKAETLDSFLSEAYMFGKEHNEFMRLLEDKSNFHVVRRSLDLFGRKAHYILLEELLQLIGTLYSNVSKDLQSQIEMFEQKAEDPDKLSEKIIQIKQEIENINNKMNKTIQNVLVRRFQGENGLILQTANRSVSDFRSKVEQINSNSPYAFNELKKESMLKIDEFKKTNQSLPKEIVDQCDKELQNLNNKQDFSYESLKPIFTDKTFEDIYEETKRNAYEIKEFETGWTFNTTEKRSEYSQNKHYNIVKENIMSRIDTIKNDLIKYLSNFCEKLLNDYKEELRQNSICKQKELDAILVIKKTADEIVETINKIIDLKNQIFIAESTVEKLRAGIAKNV